MVTTFGGRGAAVRTNSQGGVVWQRIYYFDDEMVGYFEPESVDSLAEQILALYRDPSRRRNQTEKARAFLDRYGWEKHQFDLLNLYRDLSQKKENVEC